MTVLRSFASWPQGQGLTLSYPLHAKRWGFDYPDVKKMAAESIEWFDARKVWLHNRISEIADSIHVRNRHRHTGVRKVIKNKHLYIIEDNEIYSIDGKRIQ